MRERQTKKPGVSGLHHHDCARELLPVTPPCCVIGESTRPVAIRLRPLGFSSYAAAGACVMVPVSPGCHTKVLALLPDPGVSALPWRLMLANRVWPLLVDGGRIRTCVSLAIPTIRLRVSALAFLASELHHHISGPDRLSRLGTAWRAPQSRAPFSPAGPQLQSAHLNRTGAYRLRCVSRLPCEQVLSTPPLM